MEQARIVRARLSFIDMGEAWAGAVVPAAVGVVDAPLPGLAAPAKFAKKVRFCQVAGCGQGKTGVVAIFREMVRFYQVGAPQPRKTTVVLWGGRLILL
jgi:hypothetical protein